MTFTRPEFLIFFAVVAAAVWTLPGNRSRQIVLLAASYYFYAYWDVRFTALLAFSTAVDYLAGRGIESAASPVRRRVWLVVSLATNLGLLGYFKYAGFFVESFRDAFSMGDALPVIDVVLPVGVSFFTFQTMSTTIDVYRGVLPACRDPLRFALYVAFFPQLVAGPVVRGAELLPQLAVRPRWSRRRAYGGGAQMLRGFVKKVLIADRLGEMVDVVWAGPELYSGATIGLATVAYAGQIYYDFSGYTDIAIGGAKVLGYRFPRNFRHPYLATGPADFWRRWHMTLSRWLRDYLYIPLGGSRGGRWFTARNLMLTMLLGGLWHGAAWTFVAWGALHGAALTVGRLRVRSGMPMPPAVGWTLTMATVLAGWVLFRSPDFATATTIYRRVLTAADGIDWFAPLPILAITLMVVEHAAWMTPLRRRMRLPADRWTTPILVAVALWSLILYAPRGFRPFVYFQF